MPLIIASKEYVFSYLTFVFSEIKEDHIWTCSMIGNWSFWLLIDLDNYRSLISKGKDPRAISAIWRCIYGINSDKVIILILAGIRNRRYFYIIRNEGNWGVELSAPSG